MLRKIIKTVLTTAAVILLLLIFYILVPAFPHLLFRHKAEYENFSVYFDKKLPDDYLKFLKETELRIKNLDIYDSEFHPDIFVCQSKDLYKFFAFWVRLNPNSQGFNLSLLNNTFLNQTRINTLKYYHDQRLRYTHLNGNISQVLAHELIHNLDSRHTGFWEYTEKPIWKKEGYCEYGSTISLIEKDTLYNLLKRASFYFENDLFDAPYHSKIYYRSQLMVEYLFTEKGFTFDMLNDSSVTEKKVFSELKDWYYKNKKQADLINETKKSAE